MDDNKDSVNKEDKDQVWPPAPTWQQQVAADAKVSKTNLQLRLVGVFLFLVGLGMAWWVDTDVVSGTKVSEKIVVFTPAVLLSALSFIIEPRIMLANMKDAAPQPKVFKAVGYIIPGIGAALGLYIRYTFFK